VHTLQKNAALFQLKFGSNEQTWVCPYLTKNRVATTQHFLECMCSYTVSKHTPTCIMKGN